MFWGGNRRQELGGKCNFRKLNFYYHVQIFKNTNKNDFFYDKCN